MEIGKKIKRLRLANGLTIEELANRSELSKGFISQVERDLTSPSVATLQDLVEALGSSMHDFFNEEETEQITFGVNDFFVNEQEDYTISYIIPNAQKNQMEPILITIKPEGLSKKISPFEGESFGYVLQGKVRLHYGKNNYDLKKGETFYLEGSQSHSLENIGTSFAKVVWITNPPVF